MHLISCTGICWQTFNHRCWSRPLVMPWRLRVFQLVGRVLPSFMVNINKRSFPNNVRHVIGCFHGSFQSQCGLKIRWKAIWYLITVDHKFNARFVREGFYYDVFIFPYLFRAVDQDKTNLIERSPFFIFIGFSRFTKAEVTSLTQRAENWWLIAQERIISDLFVYRAVLRYTKSLSEVNNISHSTWK